MIYNLLMNIPFDIKVTPEGLEKLKSEQEELTAKRPNVLARMVAAREQGDLSENAGYHAARDELSHIDSRVRELKLMIRFAQVIRGGNDSTVTIGSTVEVDDGAQSCQFKIVGKLEANPTDGLVSDESPLGQTLIGKKTGEVIEFETPDGKHSYKILRVKS